MKEFLNKDLILHYHEKGWVRIRNFISKKEAKFVKSLIEEFLAKQLNKFNSRNVNFANNKKEINSINSFHNLGNHPWIKKFSRKMKVKKFTDSLLGSQSEYKASELFAKPAKIGLPSPDHQDNYYWNVIGGNALTIWVALDKVSNKNGGLYYYEKSHKYGVFEHKPSFAKGSSQTIRNKKILKRFNKVTPSLNLGDALIHSSLIIHGSEANLSNLNRKGWTLQFKDIVSKYDYISIKRYLKNLKNQIKLRKS
jgi:ectoine hydroxylase-related dioxygenase (phytanoyl-CoA dioxygenase family)